MSSLRLRHHNDCPCCPVIGAEDIPGEEYFEILALRFHIGVARKLAAKHDLIRVKPLHWPGGSNTLASSRAIFGICPRTLATA